MDDDLTRVESRNGLLYKREDLHADPVTGVNGAKWRACRFLVERAATAGYTQVVSASSVLSPQAAMAATAARYAGLESVTIVGGTTPEKAVRHPSIRIAQESGSRITAIPVGYNPALQSAAATYAQDHPGTWQMPYGITDTTEEFLALGGAQIDNLPDTVKTLVIPFGSGNTAAGVLYGLRDHFPVDLEKVVLVGIGPDRWAWLHARLGVALGDPLIDPLVQVEHNSLHGWFATYGDRMPETLDGITLHPTYEGKVVRYLNMTQPEWWTRRDDTTCFWIVGGPIS